MSRRILFSLLGLLLGMQVAWAQSRTVSGTVTSAADGMGLPGVSVVVKGTTTGTQTDMNGKFTLKVPENAEILIFSFVGLATQEVEIGNRSTIDVSMEEDLQELSEVVVTALGFKEDRDRLGSTSSIVKQEAIVKSGETGVINGLAGKAAGVQITRSSGDPGAGSYIQIRGQSTITGNLQPLIIVDGVPISNSSLGDGANGDPASNTDGVTQQSRLNDLNPDDIESVQVLKGASAAALWGTRAANGVIVITTKAGKAGSKLNISYKSELSFDQVNRKHPLQTSYGQGAGGAYSPTSALSWGDKISDRSGGADAVDQSGAYFVANNGNTYYPITQRNSRDVYTDANWDEIFQTGQYLSNSLSISGGDEKGGFFLSLSDLNQEGVIQGQSDYRRTTLRFNANRNFNEYLSIKANSSYSRVGSNRVQKGSNLAGLFLGLLRTPPDFDNSAYKGDYYAGPDAVPVIGRHRSYRRYLGQTPDPVYNNPSWTASEQQNTSVVNRIINSTQMDVTPTEWLTLTARAGIDHYQDRRTTYFPVFSASQAAGALTEEILSETQFNLDAFARAVKEFSPDFSLTGLVGFNFNNRRYDYLGGEMNSFIIPDAPNNFGNSTATNRNPSDFESVIRTAAMYATANLAFKDMLYVNLTGRGEAASTFGANNRTFFYPSADVAFQFTQLDAFSNLGPLSFGKIRAAYGMVGVQPAVYSTLTDFVAASYEESWGPLLDASYYGGGYSRDNVQGNANLKPETKTEIEIGTDLRFFDNKLRASFTYYTNETRDALFSVPVAASTGFQFRYDNAATLQNRGIELEMGYNLIRKEDFGVTFDVNWNRNRNEVTSLSGTESLFLNGFTGTSSRAVEGQPVGVLWGGRWERGEDGQVILDNNGFPVAAATEGIIGDPNPDWRGGFGTTVRYKNFRLYVLFEHQQGGDVWNGTYGVLNHFGTAANSANEVTATQDLPTYGGGVIPAGTTFRGNIMDFGGGPVALEQSWYTSTGGGFGPVGEQFVFDATWTRLRQVSLTYTLNTEGFRNATKLNSVDFSVIGRNLFLMTDWEGIDPETNLTGASNGRGLEYFNNPNTSSYLFSITINY